MTECEKYQELISAMLDGELTESERAQVEAHVKNCDECRAMYEAFAALGSAIVPDEDVPDTLHSGIMEKVNAAAKAKNTQQKIVRLRPILAAAACLVVIVGTVFALKGNLPGMKSAESEAPNAAEAPMMMAFSGAARSDGAAFDYSAANGAAMESFAITADAGGCVAEESAPAEMPAPEAEAQTDGFSASAGDGAPKEAGANPQENGSDTEAEAQRMTVEIKELMPYNAFICFLVVDTATDEVWELHLTEDTQMTDEVREALVPSCVVTVEYHTKETDQRPAIYADAIYLNKHILTVKATESLGNKGFIAEVLDAAAEPCCEAGDTVKVVIGEENEQYPFNIVPGGEYRIVVEGYEQTMNDGISIYVTGIWLT